MSATRTLGTTLVKTKSGIESVDLTVGNLTKIGDIGVESADIDVTDLDSADEYKEFIAGSKDAGEVSMEGHIKSETAFETLVALAESRSVEIWTVLYPSGAKWVFSAFVKHCKDGEKTVEGVASFKASLRVTGKPVYTPAP